jgi:hypothetical protein
MSEVRELVIHGRWSKFEDSEKGWRSFFIEIEGRQYPVKMSTKKAEIIEKAMAVRDLQATFIGSEKDSDTINPHTSQPYKDRYLNDVKEGFVGEPTGRAQSGSTAGGNAPQQGQALVFDEAALARVEEAGRRKTFSIAWSQAIEMLQHTFSVGEPIAEQFARVQELQRKIVMDVGGQWAMDRDPSWFPEALRPDPDASVTATSEPPPADDRPPPSDDDIPF